MFPSDEAAAYYLAALIDGEGHVAFRRYAHGHARHISIVNTSKPILDAATEACEQLGLSCTLYDRDRKGDAVTPVRKHQWELRIARRDALERAAQILPLRDPGKADRLRSAVASYPNRPPIDRARELYDAGRSIRQVADELQQPYSNVHLWISAKAATRPPGRPRGRKWSDSEREARMRR